MLARVSESRGQMTPADFDTVLAVLHGWLGERVALEVEVGVARYVVTRAAGVLRGADGIAEPDDDAEFAFALAGPDARFALRRDHFHTADLFPHAGRLLVALLEDPAQAGLIDERVAAVLHLTGPPLGRA